MKIIECGNETNSPDAHADQSTKFLIYGHTGAGKTYALRTLPERYRPALLLDCDRGSSALWKEAGLGTAIQFDIHDPITGEPKMYEQAIKFLQDIHAQKVEGITDEFPTIVVDSFTVMHQAITAHVMWKSFKGSGAGKNRQTMNEPPTLPEYGVITHLSQLFVQALIQLDRNLIMICHETGQVVDESGRARGGPALTPKLATTLPRYFDEVLYASATGRGDARKYTWDTSSTGLFEARTRRPELPANIIQDFSIYA